MLGWDRQLSFYHLTIFDKDDQEVLWDGLTHIGFCRDINTFKEHLHSLVTQIPPDTLKLVDEREGNVDYRWNENLQKYDRMDFR